MNERKKTTLSSGAHGLPLLGILILGLSSCASISKKDCETENFYEMGLEDGKDGKGTDRLNKYTQTCQEKGVTVAADRYNYGRKVGLAEYCDRDRGEDDAEDGKTDSICLAEKVPPYEAAYTDELHKQQQKRAEKVSKLQKEQSKLQEKQSELQEEINEVQKK